MRILILIICMTLCAGSAQADKEGGNRTYVTASDYGQFYVKSIPASSYGLEGQTKVFHVLETEDEWLYTYDWYSPEIFIYGFSAGPTVYAVQSGPWARGHEASDNQLALAFYKNQEHVKSYSTADMVAAGATLSVSVSHYNVFKRKIGFRRPWGNQIVFDVELYNGEIITFNADTGEILSKEDEAREKHLDEISGQVVQLKLKWFQKNKDTVADVAQYEITEEDLRAIDTDAYPTVPDGYRIIPHALWTPVEFEKL